MQHYQTQRLFVRVKLPALIIIIFGERDFLIRLLWTWPVQSLSSNVMSYTCYTFLPKIANVIATIKSDNYYFGRYFYAIIEKHIKQ